MNFKRTLIASALLASLSAGAAEWTLPSPGVDDTVPTVLSASATKASVSAPVEFAWRLDPAAPLAAVPAPHQARSREYWDRRGADEIARGVPIPTTAAGAIVRLSPVSGAATRAIEAREVVLRKDGRSYANGEGMRSVADSEALEKGLAPFPAGSTVFRIDPALGSGAFEIQVPAASAEVLVHVFEPTSTLQLQLEADRVAYQAGASIRVSAALLEGEAARAVDRIEGLVTSPGGQVREIRFVADKSGTYRAELPADFAAEASPGLHEVQVFAGAETAHGRVLRDARTAFAYTVPGARLTGAVRNVPARMRDPFVYLEFDVEVAAPGRYQLGGVLHGTDAQGALVPVAIAQSARKLDTGVHGMTLLYGPDVLDGLAVGAPWEIRDLQLINQVDMGLQEQRVRGLKIGQGR